MDFIPERSRRSTLSGLMEKLLGLELGVRQVWLQGLSECLLSVSISTEPQEHLPGDNASRAGVYIRH